VDLRLERRLLQLAIGVACLVPVTAGLTGIIQGSGMIKGVASGVVDFDSHFRYLSGLLLGVGIGFAASIPRVGARTPTFFVLGGIVIVGGLARMLSLLSDGMPSTGHLFGLAMELGVVPLLLLWQHNLTLRCSRRG
jgi:hypothetical protein